MISRGIYLCLGIVVLIANGCTPIANQTEALTERDYYSTEPVCSETAQGVFCNKAAQAERAAVSSTSPRQAPSGGSNIADRLAAGDACEARGFTAPSQAYSDCFWSIYHEPEAAVQDTQPVSGDNQIQTAANENSVTSGSFDEAIGIDQKHRTILLRSQGGTFVVPVSINNRLTLDFVVDSGAADVSIPADVVMTLIRTGTITNADFLGRQTYTLADGRSIPSEVFVIRKLDVGGHTVRDIRASLAPVSGALLLGQSFLSRFRSWSMDNRRHALILN